MTIGYMDPLYRAWERMKSALFQPFDPGKWLVVGFTSFLAGLVGGNWGGSWHSSPKTAGDISPSDILAFPSTALHWLTDHPGWLAEVVLPWQRFKVLGNSLFVWRICFGLIGIALVVILSGTGFALFAISFSRELAGVFLYLPILGISFLFLAIMLIAAYISLFLDSFVVPIMFRHSLSATQAWKRFLPLLKRYPGNFLLYGLFVAALYITVAIGLVLAGCFTCCIGFILLLIPYIGSVVLLPLTYTYRCLSLEFLGQFGPEYDMPWQSGQPAPPPLSAGPPDSPGIS